VRFPPLFVVVLLTSFLTAGCVSKATYQKQVDKSSRLTASLKDVGSRNQQLTKRLAAIEKDNDTLNRRLTDVLNANSGLQKDLLQAHSEGDRLQTVLSAHDKATAKSLGELHENISQLSQQKTDLTQQLETERIARAARIAHLKNTYNELVKQMDDEIKQGEVTITDLKGKLTVNMVERILFDSGKAEIKPQGLKVLRKVGEILKKVKDKAVRVTGYTDNVPISAKLRATFPSNWELSALRAINVVHFLQDQIGIPGERLSACGYGPYQPVASNATAAGRAQNRRIQIELVPLEGRIVKPLGTK